MGRSQRSGPATRRQTLDGGWPEWADAIAVEQLQAALRGGALGHAYLLAGPNGVGKDRLARAFAQAICCTSEDARDPVTPCGICRSCRNIARAVHPDVERFDLEAQAQLADKPSRGTSLSIETMRRLRASAALLPLEAPRRLLIVDDAETLLEPAQQALLKILEEPPPHVTILLLSDEAEALLETVRSRCQMVVVRPVANNVIDEALRKQGIAPDDAREIIRFSRGRAAWAMAAAEDRQMMRASRKAWDEAESWLAAPSYDRLVTAFRLGDQFAKRRGEVIGIVQTVIQVMREAMLAAATPGVDQGQGIDEAGHRIPAIAWSSAIAAALQCLDDLESNVRPRLALEAMVLAWPNAASRTD